MTFIHKCFYILYFINNKNINVSFLTLIPSNLDKALNGLKALSVRRDLMGPRSE